MIRRARQFAVLILVALAASGCARPSVRIANPDATLPPAESSAAFLDRISSQVTVSENDAMRGILLLTDGKDEAANFNQRIKMLTERGIVPREWDYDADRGVTYGRLAYMIYKACKLRGGVTLTLFGPSQWYALRELQYQRFIGPGAIYSKVPGMEFVGVIGRSDAYLTTGEVPEILVAPQ